MNIAVVTSAKTDDEARQLLKLMGMPFRNRFVVGPRLGMWGAADPVRRIMAVTLS